MKQQFRPQQKGSHSWSKNALRGQQNIWLTTCCRSVLRKNDYSIPLFNHNSMSIITSSEWLFFHLWKRQSTPHGVIITDTVIYRWSQPFFYYSMSPDGVIIRKTKQRIKLEEIEQKLRQEQVGDAISFTISSSRKKEKQNYDEVVQVQESNVFQYQWQDNFKAALYNDTHKLSLMFQKFVVSKQPCISTVRVEWSPYFCFISRRSSVHHYKDTRVNLHERIATYQGMQFLSKQELTSMLLTNDIHNLCRNINNHIRNVSADIISIARMTLYLRVDASNKIVLLYASQIRLNSRGIQGSKKLGSVENRLTLKKNLFRENKGEDFSKIQHCQPMANNRSYCINCEIFTYNLYELSLKHIIQSTEKKYVDKQFTHMSPQFIKMRDKVAQRKKKDLGNSLKKVFNTVQQQVKYLCDQLQLQQKQKNYEDMRHIPYLILKICGSLSLQKYSKLKNNKSWIDITCRVCQECFIAYTEHSIQPKKQPPMKPPPPTFNKYLLWDPKQQIISLPTHPHIFDDKSQGSKKVKIKKRVVRQKTELVLSTAQQQQICRQLSPRPIKNKFKHDSKYDPSRVYSKRGVSSKRIIGSRHLQLLEALKEIKQNCYILEQLT